MKQSKLYKCPDYCLLIYPTEEKASSAAPAAAAGARASPRSWASVRANYWSKRLNCSVRFSELNEIFMCLNESKDEFAHVLFGEKQGWIIDESWLEIEEIE